MGNKDDGVWLDDLFCERLSGSEKLLRDIYRTADEFFLLVRLNRYPLVSNMPQYRIIICKVKQGKWRIIFEESGMELEPVLKKIKKKLEKYKEDNKEYIIQKAGGGEFI